MKMLPSLLLLAFASVARAEDPVFSGPQPGEKMPSFKMRGVFGDLDGKEIDLVAQAAGKPIALIFVHDFNRPSAMLTRILMNFTAKRSKEGLVSGVVMLGDDMTEMENTLRRAQHALPTQVPIGISVDGREGPGAYGLNRNVTMTILVGSDHQVRANFALVQPSVQADAERIAKAIVEVTGGGKPPTVAELTAGLDGQMQKENPRGAAELDPLMRQLIQKANDDQTVERTAGAIEKLVASNEPAKKLLGERAARIVNGGKLDIYGTPAAQGYLRKWAEKYGPKTK